MNPYRPRPDVVEALHGKSLVMIVGPAAVGKSSIMNEAIRYDAGFARVSGLTTRQRRPDDEPGLYRYVSSQEAERLIAKGQLVQYVIHPTTGKLYGTENVDFPGYYNLQDTLSTSVNSYFELPFARHVLISLCAEPSVWRQWFEARYPTPGDERNKRLREAKSSIEWSLTRTDDHHWLVNRPDQLSATAEQLVAIARGAQASGAAPDEARALLATVNDLLSYK